MANKDKTPVNYPFQTKAQIKARLNSDPEYRRQAMVTLYELQTMDEQDSGTTKHSNRRGFMSSHAVNGTRIAKAIMAGEELTDDDNDKVDAIAPRYSRQLATLARENAIAADPALNVVAAVFGCAS